MALEMVGHIVEHFQTAKASVKDGHFQAGSEVFRVPRSVQPPRHPHASCGCAGTAQMVVAEQGLVEVVEGRKELGKGNVFCCPTKGEEPSCATRGEASFHMGVSLEGRPCRALDEAPALFELQC